MRSLLLVAVVAGWGCGSDTPVDRSVETAGPYAVGTSRFEASSGGPGSYVLQAWYPTDAEAWKIEVADAGHWSVSDLAGLTSMFAPGCGEGIRQTDGADFSYLDPAVGREVTAAYVTAFFRATLEDDAGARAYLNAASSGVAVEHHD